MFERRHLAAAVFLMIFSARLAVGQVRLGPDGPYTPKPAKAKKSAQPASKPDQPEVFRIVVSPAAEPDLPLKYSFTPKYEDVKPGNSVPFYYRAVISLKGRSKESMKPFRDNYGQWMDEPLTASTKQNVQKFLGGFDRIFEELRRAAHRETTDWSWRLKDVSGVKAISFLLPEVQEMRQLARLIALKAKLEIANKRYDDAVETLQMGYKLAQDVAVPPTLINDLVGVAIAEIMNEQVRAVIASPDSPNLYWALSRLPRPMIDMRPALEYEMSLPMKLFPSLKNAETADHSPQEWGRILTDAFLKLGRINGNLAGVSSQSRLQAGLGMTALALKGYPRAKRDLIEWGYDPERVEAMPVGQVITIHQARTYRYMYQEMMKWAHLPYHLARDGARKSEEKLKREGYFGPFGRGREIIPLARLLLPATAQAQHAGARLDTRLAGLQALEAIRMYAAGHEGKLPATLSDIRAVPVPRNPLNTEPFPYRFAAGKAVLQIPAPPGQPARAGWRFEITIRKPAR